MENNNTEIVIYVAGAYRGRIEDNVKTAETYAGYLARKGFSFICPHSNGYPHEQLELPQSY